MVSSSSDLPDLAERLASLAPQENLHLDLDGVRARIARDCRGRWGQVEVREAPPAEHPPAPLAEAASWTPLPVGGLWRGVRPDGSIVLWDPAGGRLRWSPPSHGRPQALATDLTALLAPLLTRATPPTTGGRVTP